MARNSVAAASTLPLRCSSAACSARALSDGVAPAAEGFESRTGRGVMGRVDGRAVALGNARLLAELGVAAGEVVDLLAAGDAGDRDGSLVGGAFDGGEEPQGAHRA